jgi:hypothetical protein
MNVDATKQSNMGTIEDDMKHCLDTIFKPLNIKVEAFEYDDTKNIDYYPPFYLDNKCNEIGFGVQVQGEWSYPLVCRSDWYKGEFVIANADDWINHGNKFVAWHDECVDLINRIRSN